MRDTVITSSLQVGEGKVAVPSAPGLGVDIDEGEIARYPSTLNVALAKGAYAQGTEGEHVYVQSRVSRARYMSTTRPR